MMLSDIQKGVVLFEERMLSDIQKGVVLFEGCQTSSAFPSDNSRIKKMSMVYW
jgi:hypothetical protein